MMADMTGVQKAIFEECLAIADMLLDKNRKYGNSALEPQRVFSQASPEEQILVRIDDKLSRIKNGATDEDAVKDLIGYLVLLRVQRRLSTGPGAIHAP